MYSKTLLAVLALSAGSLSHVAAQLQCGDITDLVKYCENDCGDSEYKSAECGAYGADCYCINKNGEVENTNIDAPIQCQGTNVEITCAKECGKVQNIEDFSCDNQDVNCVCAADDGIKGLGDDAPEELLEYADQQDDVADYIANELADLPAAAPLDVPFVDTIPDSSPPSDEQVDAPAPLPEISQDTASSSLQTTVGSFVLAAAFGLVLA